jgi:hypothetical protein
MFKYKTMPSASSPAKHFRTTVSPSFLAGNAETNWTFDSWKFIGVAL